MKYYYFLDTDQTIIRICSKRKPTEKTVPRRGTWVLNEYHSNHESKWIMPAFPEIVLPTLKRMKYIGCTEISEESK